MDNVFIITDGNDFCGNGFIINNGFALTNSHVLRDGGRCFLLNEEQIKFDVIKDFGKGIQDTYTEILDYALLYSENFHFMNRIIFRHTEVIRLEQLSTVAYSIGKDTADICTGYCNFPLNKTLNTGSIVFKGECLPVKGNSGCPVIDSNSHIAGLFFGYNRNHKTGYFIKMNYLLLKVMHFLGN